MDVLTGCAVLDDVINSPDGYFEFPEDLECQICLEKVALHGEFVVRRSFSAHLVIWMAYAAWLSIP